MSVESTSSDPYEVVLADLRAKKAQIEQAISAIEILRGGAAAAPVSGQPGSQTAGQNGDIDSPGAFLGMSIADAAKKLLAAKRQPLRNPDIAAAFKRGGLVLNSKDPVNTIGSVLTRRSNEVGDLVKVGRGEWGLKEWYPGRSFGKRPERDAGLAKGEETDASGNVVVASVPFMITQEMREKLSKLGATEEAIRDMTPQEAHDYIAMFE